MLPVLRVPVWSLVGELRSPHASGLRRKKKVFLNYINVNIESRGK